MIRYFLALFLAAPLFFALPAHQAKAQSQKNLVESVIFTTLEKRLIREVLGEQAAQSEDRQTSHKQKGKDKGKGKNKGPGKKQGKGREKGSLPPGLAKKDGLPPGLAKRQTLPPGLQTRPLPRDLEHDLPPRHKTDRVIIDNDVLLIERGTNLVLDILEDVIQDAL